MTRSVTVRGLTSFVLILSVIGCRQSTQVAQEEKSQSDVATIANYDDLNESLAKRVRTALGIADASSTTQILVTANKSGIGSIFRTGGRWIPVDDSSCQFPVPTKAEMPNVFTTYEVNKALAASVGLDSSLIQALAKFDVNISNDSSFSFSIQDAEVQVLSDNTFASGLSKPTCANAVKAANNADLYVVRGYVSGKRAFTTSVDTKRLVQAGVTKIANFDINAGSGKATLGISDDKPMEFLQILELIPARPGASSAPPAASVSSAPPSPSVPKGAVSIIYVQQNLADDKSVGIAARDILSRAGLPVEKQVESLKGTPNKTQVKYFRDADQVAAAHVAELLAAKFGNVDAIRAKAPNVKAGQVEVWIAKQ